MNDRSQKPATSGNPQRPEPSVQAILEALPVAATLIDEKERILFINQRFTRLFGYTHEDLPDVAAWFPLAYPDETRRKEALESWKNVSIFQQPVEFQEQRVRTMEVTCKKRNIRNVEVYGANLGKESIIMFLDVTDRETVLEERRQLTSIVNRSPVIVIQWRIDQEWPVEFVSESISQLGYTVEEFISGRVTWEKIIHEDDRKRLNDEVTRHLKDREDEYTQEYRLFHKSGDIRWVEDRNKVLYDSQGRATHIQGLLFDVTERKQAESALVESEKRFFNVIQSSPMGVFLYELKENNRLIFSGSNKAAEDILGLDCLQFVGQTIEEAFPPLADTELPDQYRRVAREGGLWKTQQVSYQYDRISGAYDVYVFQIKPNTVAVFFLDVTERKRAHEKIRMSEEKYRTLFENMNEGFAYHQLITDIDGRPVDYVFLEVNKTFEAFTDLNSSEIVGRRLTEVLPEVHAHHPELVERYGRVALDGIQDHFEIYVEPMKRWYSVSAFSPKQYFFCTIFEDITDRKKAEEKQARLLNEKEILLKEIHHRVKNNFTIISSLLYLQSSKMKDETARRMCQDSRNRVKTMALVHEQLYRSSDLASIGFSRYVKRLIKELYQSYGVNLAEIDLNIQMEDVKLRVEKAIPCGLILNELISNVFKYAFPPELKKKKRIRIRFKQTAKGDVLLNVCDNGRGLSDDFDISQISSLGLKLVSMLTEDQLDGKLTIRKRPMTCFEIRFPLN